MEIIKNSSGTNSRDYALCLGNLSKSYYYIGNYDQAILLGAEALETTKNTWGTNHQYYASCLSNLAVYYSAIGNYNDAIKTATEARAVCGSVLGLDHPDYSVCSSVLADCLFSLGKFNEAIQLANESMETIKSSLGTEHPYYATCLNNLANFYSYLGNYDEAIQLSSKVIEIRKRVLGIAHPDYACSLRNLAYYYARIRNYDEAILLGKKAVDILKKVFGQYHPNYALSLRNLANYYTNLCDYNAAMPLIREHLSIERKDILRTFSGLTSNERLLYWNKYNDLLNSWIPEMLVSSGVFDAPALLYDNNALFAKGLLLSTELEMTSLIHESGDVEALQMYSNLRQNRQVLNLQYSKPITERYYDCDSLENVCSNLERQLVFRVKEFGNFARNLNITWHDVLSKLEENDIAIEFLSYPEHDGTTVYVALTLCNGDTTPVLTPLFVESQLHSANSIEETYQTSLTDALIWEPLSSRLKGKSHVYFSASGLLHNIGIEYLPSMEGKECYRLSSTRELVTHQPSEAIGSATLYGDIDYDATYASIESSAPSSRSDYAMNTTSNQYRSRFDYRSMRYGVSPLPGTREEIKEVSALLKPLGKPCDTLTGAQASEESFKNLSGQRKSLLHISTHGFYYTDEEANNLNDHLQMMLIGDNGPTNFEDRSLLRCGLCFAGANQTLSGESQPSAGQGDGILNALEIAQTDLRGLNLVVLSACQTALGDISLGEGVFGLQRGFKKAGAQSILMSLWEVDDEITQLFMTEFYRAWTSGQTKTASLKTAQSIIKAKHPDPRHWAAFILLDALD